MFDALGFWSGFCAGGVVGIIMCVATYLVMYMTEQFETTGGAMKSDLTRGNFNG